MMFVDEVAKWSSSFEEGVILDEEFSWMVITAILEDGVNVTDALKLIPYELKDVMLEHIGYIESNNYINPNPFIHDGLTDADHAKRANKLMNTYKKAFSTIRAYFEDLERDRSSNN